MAMARLICKPVCWVDFDPNAAARTPGRVSLAPIMNVEPATGKTLFDFQNGTDSAAWEVVNDEVMGGVSSSQFQVLTARTFTSTVSAALIITTAPGCPCWRLCPSPI